MTHEEIMKLDAQGIEARNAEIKTEIEAATEQSQLDALVEERKALDERREALMVEARKADMLKVAQGAGNIASAMFGGIPATGAIARTAANAKNGGRTPIAGMIHAVVLLLILVILMPYAALIPMPTIAAILFMVAYNMCEWRKFVHIVKTSPKSDIIVLVLTFALTVIFDLVVAIEVGMVLACLLFMKRMSDVTEVEGWKYIDDLDEGTDPDCISLREVPKNTLVYEISGPMFFGAAEKITSISLKEKDTCLFSKCLWIGIDILVCGCGLCS